MKKMITLCALFAVTTCRIAADTATFDSKDTSPNGYYMPGSTGNHDWSDGGMTFNMNVYDFSWNGFTYSDVNDTTTAGYGNQYAVYGDGLDHSDSGVYAVGYADAFNAVNPMVSFASAMTVNGFYANNTTYAALDMLNGSTFSKKFGGATGDDADWFLLTIEGFDAGSASLGTVNFYLADYRFADNEQDYVIADWAWVDLTGLGSNVSSLEFSLTSSDNSYGYMNTPAYFAADHFQAVPEPASALLILLGATGISAFRRLRASYGLR
jgi:hypothetical protein